MPLSADPSAPKGDPQSPHFRSEIQRLAGEAAQDALRQEEATRKLAQRRPFSVFVSIGVTLIILQVVALVVLYSMQRWQISRGAAPKVRMDSNTECAGTLHRTYWKVVAFIRDQHHPPAALDELLGKYVDKLPADPRTGKPLEYAVTGDSFTLRCPGR